MDIKDVKVGDRCWVAVGSLIAGPVDESGQNATVADVKDGRFYVKNMGWFTPCVNAFWRKPEAPPKPKRIVTVTRVGTVDKATTCFTERWAKVEVLFPIAGCPRIGAKATVSWEEEQ